MTDLREKIALCVGIAFAVSAQAATWPTECVPRRACSDTDTLFLKSPSGVQYDCSDYTFRQCAAAIRRFEAGKVIDPPNADRMSWDQFRAWDEADLHKWMEAPASVDTHSKSQDTK